MATERHVQRLRDRGRRYSKNGKRLHTSFQSDTAALDGRIAPNRRWFGNTRVVSQRQLDEFRAEVERRSADPRAVILRERALPMGLLDGPATGGVRGEVVNAASFAHTFGKKAQRTRPALTAGSMEELAAAAAARTDKYDVTADRDTTAAKAAAAAELNEVHEAAFGRAQTSRVFAELYKVIDCSDVIIQVLDARDPMGTRSAALEAYLRKPENRHRHMILLMNKCDLVPPRVTRRWVQLLSKEYPTVAFRASIEQPFGKGSLIGLLRQYARLHRDKKQITIGLAGYPNVGKSSLINSLVGKRACTVAPVPGETKIWQYVTLTQRMYLVDCPGVVHPDRNTANVDLLLRGVIRPERIKLPSAYIPELLDRADAGAVARTYLLTSLDAEGRAAALAERAARNAETNDDTPLPTLPDDEPVYWIDSDDFLERLALRSGRLLPGAQPDIETCATTVLRDWQRGRIPFFYPPPNAEESDLTAPANETIPETVMNRQAGADAEQLDAAVAEAVAEAGAEPALGDESGAEADAEDEAEAGSAAEKDESSEEEEEEDVDWGALFRRAEPRLLEEADEAAKAVAQGQTPISDALVSAGKPKRIRARDIELRESTLVDIAAKAGKSRVKVRRRVTGPEMPSGPRLSKRVNLSDDTEYISKPRTVPQARKRRVVDEAAREAKRRQRKAASTKRRTGDQFYAEARKKREIIAKKVGHKIA